MDFLDLQPEAPCVDPRKVDARLPGNGNSHSHCARPVHLIITIINWIRTSRLSVKNSLSLLVLVQMQTDVFHDSGEPLSCRYSGRVSSKNGLAPEGVGGGGRERERVSE